MSMADELSGILKALQLSNHVGICDRAREIYRKSLMACPSLGQLERCRPFVSIELACTEFKHAFDRAFTVRFSASNKEQYHQAYESIVSALKLTNVHNVSFTTLALQHGCDAIIDSCHYILDKFMEKYLPTLSPEQRQHVSRHDHALVAAIFVSVAASFKTRIDKKILLEKNKINQKAYMAYSSLVKDLCRQDLLNLQTEKCLLKTTKRAVALDDNGSELDQEHKSFSNPTFLSYNKNDFDVNPEYERYLTWRAEITEQALQLLQASGQTHPSKSTSRFT